MSQTKYKIPTDLKVCCINFVRGYRRLVENYHKKRNDIIYSTPSGDSGVSGGNKISDDTYYKNVKLERIEHDFDTVVMKAIEQAKLSIGLDIQDEEQRQKLAEAIWDSCILGRNFKFDYYDLPMGNNNFYERRRRFLWSIAKNMHLL